METKKVKIDIDSNIDASINNLKALKKAQREVTAGTPEWQKYAAAIRDVEDAIEDAKDTGDDFFGQMENAPGVLGTVGQGIRGMEKTFSSFNGALKASVIGLIVMTLGGLVAAFRENDVAMKKLQPLLDMLERTFRGVFRAVEPFFNAVIDFAIDAMPYVMSGIGGFYSAVVALFTYIKEVGSGVLTFWTSLATLDFDGMKAGINQVIGSISKTAETYTETYKKFTAGTKELTKAEKENLDERNAKLKKHNEERAAIAKKNAEEEAKRAKEEADRINKIWDDAAKERQNLEAQRFAERMKAATVRFETEKATNKQAKDDNLQLNIDADTATTQQSDATFNALTSSRTGFNETTNKLTKEGKLAILNLELEAAAQLFDVMSMFAGKNKQLQKAALIGQAAVSIASIIANTNVGAAKEVATKGIFGLSTSAILYAKMGLSIASVVAATAKGLQGLKESGTVPSSGSSGSGGGGGGGSEPRPPQFNIIGSSGTNQLAQAIGSQTTPVVKAYVVASDVTTAQSLDRNRVNSASI